VSSLVSGGILHPGEMGSSVGASLMSRGHRVLWLQAGLKGHVFSDSEVVFDLLLSSKH
jgi:hypothetical protein